MNKSRREFLTDSTKFVAAASLPAILPSLLPGSGPGDKIVIGLIGANSQGNWDLLQALKQSGVVCGAICDIDDAVLSKRSGEIEKIQGKKPVLYKNHRKLLDDKNIDAVIIGTPDHWHCLQMTDACAAGKDVYIEKPLANSIRETDLMVQAVRKYNRIVQVGQQQRSGDHFNSAMTFIKEGNLGSLRKIQLWANFNYGIGQSQVPDEPVPAGVDFDRWLGPAAQRPFNRARFHGSWRMFWDYGGGLMTDWGVHLVDIALWAKEVTNMPLAVSAAGGNFSYADHAHETFDTMNVLYQMPDYTMSWENTAGIQTGPYGRSYGIAFIGNNGTLVIDRGSWDLYPESEDGKPKIPTMTKQVGHDSHELHVKNWLDCIRSRTEPNCPVEKGRMAAIYCHLGNIALRSNSRLQWNDAGRNFGQDATANSLITPSYRSPWKLPS